jgi:hypothetical protein
MPDDEELAQALDLHSLISSQFSLCDLPPQTAEEVIDEIDEIMMQVQCHIQFHLPVSFLKCRLLFQHSFTSDLTTDSCGSLSQSFMRSSLSRSTSTIDENARLLEDRMQEASLLARCEESKSILYLQIT